MTEGFQAGGRERRLGRPPEPGDDRGSERSVRRAQPSAAANRRLWATASCRDDVWDAFAASRPEGHYMQGSLWARSRESLGWRAVRVVVTDGGSVLAGAQLLTRTVPVMGGIAHAARGPLDASNDLAVGRLLVRALRSYCRSQRIGYLAIQPAGYTVPIAHELGDWGFRPTVRLGPASATLRVDLRPAPDDILAAMSRSTRRNIRRGLSRGLRAREGTAGDLPTFYRLLSTASERKGFAVYPGHYYAELWRLFAARGCMKLFVVECDGEPISAQLAIVFNGVMYGFQMAWSGHYADRKPNELLDWTAMMWAKANGCRYYDFDGVDREAAEARLRGDSTREPPNPAHDSMVSAYKFGFGGHVVLLPETQDYVHSPLLRWAYRSVLPRIEDRIDLSQALARAKHLAGGAPA